MQSVSYQLCNTFLKSIIVDRPRPALSLHRNYLFFKGLLYAVRPLREQRGR